MLNIRKIALSAAIALGTTAIAGSALAEGLVGYDESVGVIALTTNNSQSGNVTWTASANSANQVEPGIGFYQTGKTESHDGSKVEWLASAQPGASFDESNGFYRVVN